MIQQPQPVRQCELCCRQYVGQTEAAGICPDCCGNLGGGQFSARIVQSEARAIADRRAAGYSHHNKRKGKR